MLTIHAICNECLKSNSIDVHPDDYRNYMYNNQLVQNVWPDLNADQREIIVGHNSGLYYCAPCWDKLFEDDDKYDEDLWPEDTGKDNWRTESPYCQEIIL